MEPGFGSCSWMCGMGLSFGFAPGKRLSQQNLGKKKNTVQLPLPENSSAAISPRSEQG